MWEWGKYVIIQPSALTDPEKQVTSVKLLKADDWQTLLLCLVLRVCSVLHQLIWCITLRQIVFRWEVALLIDSSDLSPAEIKLFSMKVFFTVEWEVRCEKICSWLFHRKLSLDVINSSSVQFSILQKNKFKTRLMKFFKTTCVAQPTSQQYSKLLYSSVYCYFHVSSHAHPC